MLFGNKKLWEFLRCYQRNTFFKCILADSDVHEVIDTEIEIKFHSEVKGRADFYINKIDDKLKVYTENIIKTDHGLGGFIAYYLYLLYVKRHLEGWGQKNKASRFKAALFSAPALTTKSEKENIANFDIYVNWYKYCGDCFLFIIDKAKNYLIFFILSKIFSSMGFTITEEVYTKVQEVSYGQHHPGHKYHLINEKKMNIHLIYVKLIKLHYWNILI